MLSLTDALSRRPLALSPFVETVLDERYAKTWRHPDFPHFCGYSPLMPLLHPELVEDVHDSFAAVGVDLLRTATLFGSDLDLAGSTPALLSRIPGDINALMLEATGCARRVADRWNHLHPEQPRFVVGTVGLGLQYLGVIDPERPDFRRLTFDQLKEPFRKQLDALHQGGVDIIEASTVYDTLTLKVFLQAYRESSASNLPLMISFCTAPDGFWVSAQDLESAAFAIESARPFSIGLESHCRDDRVRSEFAKLAARCQSFTHYSVWTADILRNPAQDKPWPLEAVASHMKTYADAGIVNIAGLAGRATIAQAAVAVQAVRDAKARSPAIQGTNAFCSALRPVSRRVGIYLVATAPAVAITRDSESLAPYREYLAPYLAMERRGLEIGHLDLDDVFRCGLDIRRLLRLWNYELFRIPLLIESSSPDHLESALKEIPGRPIVSLKNPNDETFRKTIQLASGFFATLSLSANPDAKGADERIASLQRARQIAGDHGFRKQDLVFKLSQVSGSANTEQEMDTIASILRTMKLEMPKVVTWADLREVQKSHDAGDDFKALKVIAQLHNFTMTMVVADPQTILHRIDNPSHRERVRLTLEGCY